MLPLAKVHTCPQSASPLQATAQAPPWMHTQCRPYLVSVLTQYSQIGVGGWVGGVHWGCSVSYSTQSQTEKGDRQLLP